MFPFSGRKRVTPTCFGPPGPASGGGDDDKECNRSTLMATGEMVLTPQAQLRRKSIDAVSQHLTSSERAMSGLMTAGAAVTKRNAKQHMLVVRGPHWKWGDDDGGSGRPGRILCVDKRSGTVTVFWHHNDHVHGYYRCAKQFDLSVAVLDSLQHDSCTSTVENSRENSDEEQSSKSASSSTLHRVMMSLPKRNSVLSLLSAGPLSGKDSLVLDRGRGVFTPTCSRRSSQDMFAHSTQTVIIFDWDDTLFPTTYFSKGLGINPTVPLKDQKKLAPAMKPMVGRGLMKCGDHAVRLLRLACGLGKVVLVTLADIPWVDLTCRSSYPMVGQVLKELGIKVVYAKDVCKDKLRQRGDCDPELFWSKIKGECIAREADAFYSQYEGQSWKNIISIGDSQFERLGTLVTTGEYMREKGLLSEHDAVDDQEYKVRTKTVKMVGEPTLEELTCELDMLLRWLPMMVLKDSSLDVVIDDLDNVAQVRDIEEMLSKKQDLTQAVAGFGVVAEDDRASTS